MKPVLVLQNLTSDGPAYLADWLTAAQVRFDVRDSEAGDVYPDRIDGFRALAVLGGEMSANDDLPGLRQAERLILDAMAHDIPVIGHCLGGQLMARALRATVSRAAQPEIGWHRIDLGASSAARAWFGAGETATVFQWHFDAFELPRGAERLASSAACANQAFAVGRHLAMQFHVELDLPKLQGWLAASDAELVGPQTHGSTVQSRSRMLDDAVERLATQRRLADRIYGRWLTSE